MKEAEKLKEAENAKMAEKESMEKKKKEEEMRKMVEAKKAAGGSSGSGGSKSAGSTEVNTVEEKCVGSFYTSLIGGEADPIQAEAEAVANKSPGNDRRYQFA